MNGADYTNVAAGNILDHWNKHHSELRYATLSGDCERETSPTRLFLLPGSLTKSIVTRTMRMGNIAL